MPFLPPNQQRQSIEGIELIYLNKCDYIEYNIIATLSTVAQVRGCPSNIR